MNPLKVIPAKARDYVYAILAVLALGLGAYQATQGDWVEFGVLLLSSLGFGTAKTHTPKV